MPGVGERQVFKTHYPGRAVTEKMELGHGAPGMNDRFWPPVAVGSEVLLICFVLLTCSNAGHVRMDEAVKQSNYDKHFSQDLNTKHFFHLVQEAHVSVIMSIFSTRFLILVNLLSTTERPWSTTVCPFRATVRPLGDM